MWVVGVCVNCLDRSGSKTKLRERKVSEERVSIRYGFGDAAATIGIFTAAIGLFNLSVDVFGLTVGPIVEPLYILSARVFGWIDGIVNVVPEAYQPRVDTRLLVLAIILTGVFTRALIRSIDEFYRPIHKQIIIQTTATVILCLFSYSMALFWLWFSVLVVLPLKFILDYFENLADEEEQRIALYYLGFFAGYILLLVLNAYY